MLMGFVANYIIDWCSIKTVARPSKNILAAVHVSHTIRYTHRREV